MVSTIDQLTLSAEALAAEKLMESLDAFTDSLSDSLGLKDNCGSIAYRVETKEGAEAPSNVSLVYTEGDSTFKIEVDTANEDAARVIDLVLVAELVDYYPQVPRLTQDITLEILEVEEPWVPPPAEPAAEPEPPAIPVIEEVPTPAPVVPVVKIEEPPVVVVN